MATEGRIFAVSTSAADITGFDPARDKLDFGGVSVHNFIVVDTAAGVGFMDPWSGETIIIQGVSLGQLTIDSFTPIENDHLRQCLSGALAWEQGITAAPNTVYARSHELGQIDKVAFNPATDKVDFRYYGSREQISMTDGAEGVIISNAGTGQALILLGVTKAQLTVSNFIFYPAEVREDRVHLQLGFPVVPDSQVVPQGLPIAGTNAWPTGVGSGSPPSGVTGETFTLDWDYGVAARLDFDPAADKLDFGWFKAPEIEITEVGGSTVITIVGNKQSYTLTGVSLSALEMTNIVARDPGLRAEWQAALDAAPSLPGLSVSDAEVVEGDAGTVNLVFTVTLSQAASTEVSVGYTTLAGSARAGEDFTSAVGSVTFAPGEIRKTFSVAVLGERLTELTETMTVQLSGARGATILDGSATGTIRDNDVDPAPTTPPSISIVDYSTNEGDADLTHMRIVLTLSKASTVPVTVRYTSEDITANGPVDYEVLSGLVTFAPGETTQTIHAHINGDRLVEATESYRIRLSDPTNATIADGIGIVTIVNDDSAAPALPSLAIADASIAEGNAGTKVMNLTVTLSAAASGPVTVSYATANGTATAGSDYTAKTGTLTFAAGETSKTIQVTIAGDAAVEANEAFTVNLSNATGATIADGSATATITNDDVAPTLPSLAIADASIAEGNAGTKVMNLTVTLSAAASGPVTVAYATANGTATAGSDYTAKTGTLSFAAGETSKTIQVTIAGDTAVEANEAFTVNLSNATGATIADGSATATITNDDVAPTPGAASLAYKVNSDWGAGFTAAITVTAGPAALNGWTAEFDAPFTITNIWNAVIVSHVGNHYVIRNQSYNGKVNPGGETSFGFQGAGGPSGAVSGLILNGTPTPSTPSLSIADASLAEGASGTSNMSFTVTLSQASATPVTVNYATSDGTATAGSDYTAKTGSLTFAAGETSKTITVAVRGDTAVEANETLNLTLSGAQGASIGDGAAVGTIRNDDAAPSLPTLSVGNASVNEGASGTGSLTFTVTLSQASATPVSVNFATANGTATAGSDYAARTGTLTFAAGETSKSVTVTVNGDTAIEADETLSLILSAPSGSTIRTGTGTGTIQNDDLPRITVSDASIQEGDLIATTGWLSTKGNQIVDSAGNSVLISGVNWFGFEGNNMSANGLWTRSYKEMMEQMVELGFNTIRLPFSSEMLDATGQALGIDYNQNPDLRGLTPLQVMDKIVAYAGEIGLRIILDHHRSDAGNGATENGLWYNSRYSEADWISDWKMLAARYADDPTVIGADLHNEPHAGTWGGGGARDWAAAAERAGNAIGEVNPNWLIFVEGVGSYEGTPYWWGGNLMGVRDRPIELDVAGKLVYSAHDYPNSIYAQPWFQGPDFPANLPAKFDQMWGYIFREGIAPVYIGEFGTKLQDPKDAPWFEAITSYLSGDFDNNGTNDLAAGQQGISWTYWSWNPNSGDTGGILKDDWRSVHENKMDYLRPLAFELLDDAAGGALARFEVRLSAAATTAVTVDYATVAGTATDADFVAASGTLTFAPGEQSKTVTIAIRGDALDEANEGFRLVLSNPQRATIADGTGQATIIDDDPAAGANGRLVLTGTAGADTLTGGAGADLLTGGAGADRFFFSPGQAGTDRVTDFNTLDGGAAEGDLLVIAAPAVGRFAWLGTGAFTGGSDNSEARMQAGQVLVDVNGDGTAEITIALTGLTSASQLSASDFLFS
ncbi:cellulase family glycosylhydrolase [Roseococcus sp. SDR]|uniref:Calx-beta domain-containing protein n=1 Tax=Roseococcus sp. SDR TaxID=2835532 RepID=UPI001BCEA568|nr:Calx-beta domain-containing protein [Roseococcus sp. SDR]MBS7789777.1 cellulase family glycosylhydrolase [Roseococcus sp. SDR]MBV1845091.1 cellulase family glycosylhydrolase [Roseococcus sp. SDR]